MKIITTDYENKKFWEETEKESALMGDCMHVVNICPDVTYQTFHGFGGALTEAAAHVYAGMSKEKQDEIIEAYFGKTGLRYNIGRIHMNSCDFALGNYTYVEEGDDKLETFDISHDRKEILPFLAAANAKTAEGTNTKGLKLLMSPWSPPAFMKTNSEMNHGGKLKDEYYAAWAEYFVKFIRAYQEAGADIEWLTVQNEPMAVQTWDSCIYTSEDESRFVRDYLGPKLEEAGLSDIGIFVWDHNKEECYQRFKEVIADEKTRKYVKGGPNHVGNFCAAPIMCAPGEDSYEKRLTYYYIGHFSRYIKEGAVKIGTSSYTDGIEVTAFLNPDGERVAVILNKSEKEVPYTLREMTKDAGYQGVEGVIAPHSIQTIVY